MNIQKILQIVLKFANAPGVRDLLITLIQNNAALIVDELIAYGKEQASKPGGAGQ